MIDEDFCGQLEHAISEALSKSEDIELRRCWCDGILLLSNESAFSLGHLLAEKNIITKAWIDEGRTKGKQQGQFLYDMRLNLGKNTIDKLRCGERLEECIPNTAANVWIVLDRARRTIDVQLK